MGGISSMFSGRNKSIDLQEMLTPEQKQAMQALTQFGLTGQLGDFTAGQKYDMSGYNFSLSPTEMTGQTQLEDLLASGTPSGITNAQSVLTDIANQKFNPDDPSSGFAAYSRQVARAGKSAADVLNREAAISGNRFGTFIGRDKADLAAQQTDILASKLSELYNQTQANKLSAASGLGQLSQVQEAINQNRIAAAYQYGSLQRDLQNQQAQLKYDDWQRARNERMSSITGLTNVMNKDVQYGLKSYTTKMPSTFMAMAGEISPGIGSYNTQKYGYTTNQKSLSEAFSGGNATGGQGGMSGIWSLLKTMGGF